MACVGRLAGALLAETEGNFFLIGDTKQPCNWRQAGFEAPEVRDPLLQRYVKLRVASEARVATPHLQIACEGEELARRIASLLLIERNASVSERLWRLLFVESECDEVSEDAVVDATWLLHMPPRVWNVVRDAVLRCL